MENMRQQCSKCGNWVEGKKRASYTKKLAKTGVKTAVNSAASIGAASTGAAIGSAIFPGVGTLIGGAAGFLASTMFHTAVNEGIDAIAEGTEEVLSDNIVYEFRCPKCGYEWDSNDTSDKICEETASSSSFEEDVYDPLGEKFDERFTYLLDNTDKIIATRNTVLKYLDSLDQICLRSLDKQRDAALHFLSALCIYLYSEENIDDQSLLKKGQFHINQAIKLDKKDEYVVFQLVFMSMKLNHNSSNIVSEQEHITYACPNILAIRDSFLNIQDLESIYNSVRFSSLYDTCLSLQEHNRFEDFEKCLLLLGKQKDVLSKLTAYYYLSQLYYTGRGQVLPSDEKCFSYTKKAVDIIDLEKTFAANADVFLYRIWRECLSNLGILYIEGRGTSLNYQKGLSLCTKAANIGSSNSMYAIGEIYEYGKGCKPDLQKAQLWYQKAVVAGSEEAREKLKVLSGSVNNKLDKSSKTEKYAEDKKDSSIFSAESEYLEEIKACLSEDGEITSRERRLLNRLREKLGISEKRAQELEDSLTTSQLTADEQEYLDEYRVCLEEGEISSKERRLLDRLRDKLGIDPIRARELENL